MQTFLPYESFKQTACCLDYRRLGKQRIETKQILKALMGETKGWVNHPATRMWRGYEYWLVLYGMSICKEWIVRGYVDNQLPWFTEAHKHLNLSAPPKYPHWLGNEQFHASHRAALLYKAPEHYEQFSWAEEPKLEYVWPV